MITPQALLDNKPTGKVVEIILKVPALFGDSSPILNFRIPQGMKAAKINDAHVKMLIGTVDGQTEQRVSVDSIGYALDMAQFVDGWQWEGVAFDRELLKGLFQEYPAIADAFAGGVRNILTDVQERAAKALEDDKKK